MTTIKKIQEILYGLGKISQNRAIKYVPSLGMVFVNEKAKDPSGANALGFVKKVEVLTATQRQSFICLNFQEADEDTVTFGFVDEGLDCFLTIDKTRIVFVTFSY